MAGRISLLKKDIEKILSKQPHASPRYVKLRRYVLLALIDDLQAINHVIPGLSSINKNIIQKLILHWKFQGNSGNTIYLKITILRNVCKHYFTSNPIPSNQELDVAYYCRDKTVVLDNTTPLLDANNSIVKHLYRLQRYFGLKMFETIMIESYMFDNDRLCVARSAAYNNKNRFIPYWCEEQRKLVKELLIDKSITKANSKIGIEQYKTFLQQHAIIDKEHYRYQYIYYRYQNLIEKDNNPHAILRQLRRETGYKENRQIKAILKCLNAF